MKTKLLFLLFSCLLGCSNRSNSGFKPSKVVKKNISLKKLDTVILQNSDSTTIAQLLPRFAVSDDNTRMAFYDLLYKHFIITNRKGKILQVIGGAGRGPDEFIQALKFTFDEHNNFVVYDLPQHQVKIFNPKGMLEKAFTIFSSGDLANSSIDLFAKDSLIYMGITEMKYNNSDKIGKSKLMAVFDYKGQLKDTYGRYDPYVPQANYYAGNPAFYIKPAKATLYSTHLNSYRIQIFNLKTNTRSAYFGRRSPHFKESKEKIKANFPRAKIFKMSLNQSFTNNIFITSKYIIQYFRNGTKKWFQSQDYQAQHHYIAIYNKTTHNFNAELKLPYTMATVHGNKLYLIENSNPDHYTIGVFALQEHH